MTIAAVVPIKLNSSRLPQKNIKSFTNGRPLCTYILETLHRVREIDRIYVYCSNPQIREYLPGWAEFIRRSETLDTDSASITEVLCAFAADVPADIYLMTHATAPFLTSESIKKGIEAVVRGRHDSAFAARKLQDFIWDGGAPLNYSLDNIPRTQDLPVLYEETSGFYIYTHELITKRNRRIGDKPYIVEVSKIEAVDIDEAEDFVIADAVFNFLFLSRAGKG